MDERHKAVLQGRLDGIASRPPMLMELAVRGDGAAPSRARHEAVAAATQRSKDLKNG